MEDLSLHILDVVENSIRAGAGRVEVKLIEEKEEESSNKKNIVLFIIDDGSGMDKKTLGIVTSPFYSSKEGKSFGMGISLLKQAALETEGEFFIDSKPGSGTSIKAVFKSDHPDMKPLGDIKLTMRMLGLSHPEIDFVYNFENDSV
ncbi:MAG: sensor histidine kinase [Spirochaetaceae bacterium]|nr:sensor histidine kinase [Spirochaetaceae bacterium]